MRILRIPMALMTLSSTAVAAQSAPIFHFEVPSSSRYTVERSVPYAVSNGLELFLDVYRPADTTKPAPAVVLYSLFWPPDASARTAEYQTTWARIAAANGIVAVIPDLRAVPGTGTAQGGPGRALGDDFQRAMSFVMEKRERFGIDSGRVSLFAASGAVTSALRTLADSTTHWISSAVLYYGGADTTITRFRPALPVFYVRAGRDSRGMNAMVARGLSLALEANADLTLINYADGDHAFEYRNNTEETKRIVRSTLEFLQRGGRR